ncbi:MAG: hypothetical protein ACI9W2_003158 [Gammaproteobacteria bacterium]|jgi:hypothetical protein
MLALGGYAVRSDVADEVRVEGTALAPGAVELARGVNVAGVGNGALVLDVAGLIDTLGGPSDVGSIARFDVRSGRFQSTHISGGEIRGANFDIRRGEGYPIQMRSPVNALVLP